MKYPKPDHYYIHYKGGIYQVLFLSIHTETKEVLVNYRSVHFGSYYSRPLEEWNKSVILESTGIETERYKELYDQRIFG